MATAAAPPAYTMKPPTSEQQSVSVATALRAGLAYVTRAQQADAKAYTGDELDRIRGAAEELGRQLAFYHDNADARAALLVAQTNQCIRCKVRYLWVQSLVQLLRSEVARSH